MRGDPEVQRMADMWQLGLPRLPVSGRSGELLGRGTGSSLEFQEFREYLPGDDIRHIDWAAYARADTLMLRLYREEMSPRTEILLDTSRSMQTAPPGATGPSVKAIVVKQLAALFATLAARLGGRPQVMLIDDNRPLRTVGMEGLDELAGFPLEALRPLVGAIEENLIPPGRQSVRVVLSDFLFPHDPDSVIRRLAAGTSALWVIQVLNSWEADPSPMGGRRLIDAESGTESDLVLDAATIAAYRERLTRLQSELARSCRRAHARFVEIIADHGLTAACRGPLAAADLLRPA
jgi:uncharacterized protein (DUF58 family)